MARGLQRILSERASYPEGGLGALGLWDLREGR